VKVAATLAIVLVALFVLGYLGLRVTPRPTPLAISGTDRGVVTPRTDLPAPVARYAEKVAAYGMPKVDTFAVTGVGVMRRGPLTMPLKWSVEHRPGTEFVRDMQVTWFGLPVVKGLDVWQHGVGRMVVAGKATVGPEMNQGANMAAWGEAGWAPAFFFTDERIRWEPIDDTHARLVFPFEGSEDSLVYTFDPKTGLPREASGMRYKAGATGKIGWTVRNLGWQELHGMLVPTEVDVKWADEEAPWATLSIVDMAINVPVPELDADR
jgi:hypothetical protein